MGDEDAYLQTRPFVFSGLTFAGKPIAGDPDPPIPIDFRVVGKHINITHTLKVICCPGGCPDGNSAVPSSDGSPQVLAFNVASDSGAGHDTEDLSGAPEARAMLDLFPAEYASACKGPS